MTKIDAFRLLHLAGKSQDTSTNRTWDTLFIGSNFILVKLKIL